MHLFHSKGKCNAPCLKVGKHRQGWTRPRPSGATARIGDCHGGHESRVGYPTLNGVGHHGREISPGGRCPGLHRSLANASIHLYRKWLRTDALSSTSASTPSSMLTGLSLGSGTSPSDTFSGVTLIVPLLSESIAAPSGITQTSAQPALTAAP